MRRVVVVLSLLFVIAGCGGTTEEEGPFELVVDPEFVQGMIPGETCVLLAAIGSDEGSGPVTITAEATDAEVMVEPASIGSGEIAEITVIPGPAETEAPIDITVVATRGTEQRRHSISTTVMPWEDTVAETAADIFAVFTPWLAENHPEVGIGPDTELTGTAVAPMLLVVSHYAYFTDDWEIGLSWHIMVAPDDWSQIYLRHRDQLSPTMAFELSSWSTALEGGPWEIAETTPPLEVVR